MAALAAAFTLGLELRLGAPFLAVLSAGPYPSARRGAVVRFRPSAIVDAGIEAYRQEKILLFQFRSRKRSVVVDLVE
jgi:hypothetical protein